MMDDMIYSEIQQVADFERIIYTSLCNFRRACQVLGEPLDTLGNLVNDAFTQTRDLIHYGLNNSQPPQDSAIMLRYFNAIRAVVEYAEKTRHPDFVNHFSTVKEAITALGWINVKPLPCQYIKDTKEAGDYYSIRVQTNYKGQMEHLNWVKYWNALMAELLAYVKSNFITGFTWSAISGRPITAGPPPPPPPPPKQFTDPFASGDGGRQALLASLNQGSDITRNLRPVHREGAPAARAPPGAGPIARRAAPAPVVHPAKFLLEGRKWVVEYQMRNAGMIVENEDMSQSLAMYKCEESSLQVSNKINSVAIDSCKRSSISLKSVISSVEMIRCSKVKLECTDSVPLINLDSCDDVEIYLNPPAWGVEIVTSKSSSCNVSLVEESGDYREHSLPEQIKTVISRGRLVSSVLEKN